MSMRPSSKAGVKTVVPTSEMFSSNGVIEFRSGVVITPEVELGAPECNVDECSEIVVLEPKGGEEDDEDCANPEHAVQSASEVKSMVFSAVKAAVLAQNQAVAVTNAKRENAAAVLKAQTVSADMQMRRMVKEEVLNAQRNSHASDLNSEMRFATSMRSARLDSEMSSGRLDSEMRSPRQDLDMRYISVRVS